MLPMLAVMFFIFYFLILRPQKKKQKQHENMLSAISRGDTVVTAGGFFGRVCEVLDDSYIIELADGVKARILKSSISTRREAGEERVRPRKLKKKRRVRDGSANGKPEDAMSVSLEKDGEGPAGDQEPETAPVSESGEVSYEENEALVADEAPSEAENPSPSEANEELAVGEAPSEAESSAPLEANEQK
jgi:preprotein translocase subunit YajC